MGSPSSMFSMEPSALVDFWCSAQEPSTSSMLSQLPSGLCSCRFNCRLRFSGSNKLPEIFSVRFFCFFVVPIGTDRETFNAENELYPNSHGSLITFSSTTFSSELGVKIGTQASVYPRQAQNPTRYPVYLSGFEIVPPLVV